MYISMQTHIYDPHVKTYMSSHFRSSRETGIETQTDVPQPQWRASPPT